MHIKDFNAQVLYRGHSLTGDEVPGHARYSSSSSESSACDFDWTSTVDGAAYDEVPGTSGCQVSSKLPKTTGSILQRVRGSCKNTVNAVLGFPKQPKKLLRCPRLGRKKSDGTGTQRVRPTCRSTMYAMLRRCPRLPGKMRIPRQPTQTDDGEVTQGMSGLGRRTVDAVLYGAKQHRKLLGGPRQPWKNAGKGVFTQRARSVCRSTVNVVLCGARQRKKKDDDELTNDPTPSTSESDNSQDDAECFINAGNQLGMSECSLAWGGNFGSTVTSHSGVRIVQVGTTSSHVSLELTRSGVCLNSTGKNAKLPFSRSELEITRSVPRSMDGMFGTQPFLENRLSPTVSAVMIAIGPGTNENTVTETDMPYSMNPFPSIMSWLRTVTHVLLETPDRLSSDLGTMSSFMSNPDNTVDDIECRIIDIPVQLVNGDFIGATWMWDDGPSVSLGSQSRYSLRTPTTDLSRHSGFLWMDASASMSASSRRLTQSSDEYFLAICPRESQEAIDNHMLTVDKIERHDQVLRLKINGGMRMAILSWLCEVNKCMTDNVMETKTVVEPTAPLKTSWEAPPATRVTCQATEMLPLQHLADVSTKSSVSLQHSLYVPTENSDSLQHSLYVPTENNAPLQHSLYVPTENSAPLQHSLYVPTENSAPLQHSLDVLTESNVPLQHSLYVPTENSAPLQHSLDVPTESNVPLQHSLDVPTESNVPLQHSLDVRTENSDSLQHSLDVPTESNAPLQYLFVVPPKSNAQLTHLTGVTHESQITLPLSSEGSGRTECKLQHANDTLKKSSLERPNDFCVDNAHMEASSYVHTATAANYKACEPTHEQEEQCTNIQASWLEFQDSDMNVEASSSTDYGLSTRTWSNSSSCTWYTTSTDHLSATDADRPQNMADIEDEHLTDSAAAAMPQNMTNLNIQCPRNQSIEFPNNRRTRRRYIPEQIPKYPDSNLKKDSTDIALEVSSRFVTSRADVEIGAADEVCRSRTREHTQRQSEARMREHGTRKMSTSHVKGNKNPHCLTHGVPKGRVPRTAAHYDPKTEYPTAPTPKKQQALARHTHGIEVSNRSRVQLPKPKGPNCP